MGDKKRPLPRSGEFYSMDNLDEPISDEAAFTKLMNAISAMRRAFIECGFEPPVSMELRSHDDGFRLRHILPRDMILAHPTQSFREDHDDVVFSLQSVEIRYPAKYRRLVGGRIETL